MDRQPGPDAEAGRGPGPGDERDGDAGDGAAAQGPGDLAEARAPRHISIGQPRLEGLEEANIYIYIYIYTVYIQYIYIYIFVRIIIRVLYKMYVKRLSWAEDVPEDAPEVRAWSSSSSGAHVNHNTCYY